jgi:alanine racemase
VAEAWRRPAWADVDLDAVTANAGLLASLVAPAGLSAVVKADAYGHGAAPVAVAALAGGATSLAVALVEEGVALREAGILAPILILSEPGAEAMEEAVGRGLVPTVYTDEGVKAIRRAANAVSRRVDVEVKVDTGMHRVGADLGEARSIVEQVVEAPELHYAGLWTHLAVADDPADPFTGLQVERFEGFRATLAAAGVPSPDRIHAANSAGAISHPSARYDVVRCGIALYGYAPSAAVGAQLAAVPGGRSLRPALRWRSQVSLVRELAAGERTSYGRSYALATRADIATVPVGYADGVPRALFEAGGELLVAGRRRPLAGTVTMDQLLVDCGPDSGVRPGDEVVLIGSQGPESVTAQEWADRLGTISYEILCGIGPRVTRRHTGSGAP